MNPAKALGDKLITLGVVTDVTANDAWPLYYAKEPSGVNSADAVVTLYNSGGTPPNPKWLIEFPSVQCRVRGAANGYLLSRAKVEEIKDKLLGIDAYDALDGSGRMRSVTIGADIVDLPFDEKNRPIHVVNFRLQVEPASSANRLPIS